jgi:hypothetical protein
VLFSDRKVRILVMVYSIKSVILIGRDQTSLILLESVTQ